MKRKNILIIIFTLAFFLRIYNLPNYPSGLNADEAALGYNTYSLLKTGRDEFGHRWPINFQSFNDWKPGFYVYLSMPFIKILGLNEWAVRLPSAILGSLTVVVIYLLVEKMFKTEGPLFPISVASLLAISPWHLHFSRGAWETNVSTFFVVFGIYLFFLALEKPKYYPLSILSFFISMFTYHSARLVVPLLGFGIFVFYRKKIFAKDKFLPIVLSVVLGVFLSGVLLFSMTGQAGISRFSGVGIFADQGPFWRANEMRSHHPNPYSLRVRVLHNKILEYSIRFLENYLRHFEGKFLFISGDEINRNRVPEMGQMYLIEAPFLFLGFYFILKKKPKNYHFLFWWLAVSPVASALTFQSPHAIRALNMSIPLIIITGYGLINTYECFNKETPKVFNFITLLRIPRFLAVKIPYLQKTNQLPLETKRLKSFQKWVGIVFCLFLITIYLWNFSFYLHQYFVHYPKEYPDAWEYGFKELVDFLNPIKDNYQKIYVTDKYDQPYILFLFYLKYPPQSFQKEAVLTPRDKFGFSTVRDFANFHFEEIKWDSLKDQSNVLIIGTDQEIPKEVSTIKTIYFKNFQPAFQIVAK